MTAFLTSWSLMDGIVHAWYDWCRVPAPDAAPPDRADHGNGLTCDEERGRADAAQDGLKVDTNEISLPQPTVLVRPQPVTKCSPGHEIRPEIFPSLNPD